MGLQGARRSTTCLEGRLWTNQEGRQAAGGYVDRATYCTHLADIYGAAHLGVADYPRPTCAQVRRRLSEATA